MSPPSSVKALQAVWIRYSKQNQGEGWQPPLSPSGKDPINNRVTCSGSMTAGVTMGFLCRYCSLRLPFLELSASSLSNCIIAAITPPSSSRGHWSLGCFAKRTFPTCLRGQQCVVLMRVSISELGGKSKEKTHLCSFVWPWHHEMILCLVLGHHPKRLTTFGYLPSSADETNIKTQRKRSQVCRRITNVRQL